jgi:DNA-binding NarL/FixJ family response regulator
LRLLACGLDNGKIAETLSVSPKTVRNHIEHLLAKFGVHSKLEAVVYAARAGLV